MIIRGGIDSSTGYGMTYSDDPIWATKNWCGILLMKQAVKDQNNLYFITKPKKMKHYLNILSIFLIALIAFQCQESAEQTYEEGLPKEVVESIEKRIAEGMTPSIAIALIDSSGVQYFNFGKTAEGGKPVDENTIYEIGSISKVFTGILLAQQVLDGDIKLDDDISTLLPDSISVPTMGGTAITFGHLSDHTSGLPRMPDNFAPANPNNPYADYSVEQMYTFVSTYEPVRAVGAEYEYSNFAQGLLGHMLAEHQNTTYEDLMVQTIAEPLEMNDTRINFTKSMRDHLALGHAGKEVVENWDIPTLAGAGGIRSSSSDMAKFISANLGYVNTPLDKAMEMSHEPRHSKANGMSVGMGWHIKPGTQGDVIWHNGGTGGYRTFVGFVKDAGKGVVLLTNAATDSDDIGFHLLDSGSSLKEIQGESDAVEVAEATLEKYVGVYALQPEFNITITKEGRQLYGQATGQQRFEMYPENDTSFFLTVVEAKVTFQMEEDSVKSLTLFQAGQEMPGKKVE
ncbi:serine hydrolase [Catalinimonas niigatensis]|uniref:serine hydrolase n=1 Tax=Catalinimonas niigatensis TaxID=1397264 RepID=UPI00266673AF|nr:serine hydrolase [Catalinimonas niigatensis]WPP49767.1 serine hydrolase [Catalinimonas niigatensis]